MRKKTKAYRVEARRIRREYEKTAQKTCSDCISRANIDHCPAWDSYCGVQARREELDTACDVGDSDIDKPWCQALMEHIRSFVVVACVIFLGIACYLCFNS